MCFSAGGILAGEMLLNWNGTMNGAALDAAYLPDVLDNRPHGYGFTESWLPAYTDWLEGIFTSN